MSASRRSRFRLARYVVCAALLHHPAFAETPKEDGAVSAVDPAQSLFDDAVRLMERGDFTQACPKLAESERLDPSGGTALNLGYCLEKLERFASAHVAYEAALTHALRDRRADRATLAKVRLAALAQYVSRLQIRAAPEVRAYDGLTVYLDENPLEPPQLNAGISVDAGSHVLRVTANHRLAWSRTLAVPGGANITVDVPPLALVATEGTPPEKSSIGVQALVPPPARAHDDRRTVAWITGAGSLTLLGVGGVFGVIAARRHSESNENCPAGACNDRGVAAEQEANRAAWIADAAIGAGIVAAGVTAYLWLTSGKGASGAQVSADGAIVRF